MTAPAVAVVGRLLRGVAALAATAAILVGAPILLWWLGAPLLPDHVPSGPEVLAALDPPGRRAAVPRRADPRRVPRLGDAGLLDPRRDRLGRRPPTHRPDTAARVSRQPGPRRHPDRDDPGRGRLPRAGLPCPHVLLGAAGRWRRTGRGRGWAIRRTTPAHATDADRGSAGGTAAPAAPTGSGTSGPASVGSDVCGGAAGHAVADRGEDPRRPSALARDLRPQQPPRPTRRHPPHRGRRAARRLDPPPARRRPASRRQRPGVGTAGHAGHCAGRRCPRRHPDRDRRRASRHVGPLPGDLRDQPRPPATRRCRTP